MDAARANRGNRGTGQPGVRDGLTEWVHEAQREALGVLGHDRHPCYLVRPPTPSGSENTAGVLVVLSEPLLELRGRLGSPARVRHLVFRLDV